jgi:hypothetical protein
MAEVQGQTRSNFWSRRRAAVEAEARAEEDARLAAELLAEDQARAAAQAEKTDDEILADLGLPDPDLMKMGDDFSAFMSRAVPEHLRRRALRKLWLSNPVLANLDGLLDHNDDFTDAATVFPDMKTSYQVGKGLLAHVEALAKAAEEKERRANEPLADVVALADTPEAEVTELAVSDDEDDTEIVDDAVGPDEPQAEELPATPRPRHLRFEFAS